MTRRSPPDAAPPSGLAKPGAPDAAVAPAKAPDSPSAPAPAPSPSRPAGPVAPAVKRPLQHGPARRKRW